MISCGIFQGDNCEASLQPDWRYCPLCGRKTAVIELDGTTFEVERQMSKPVSLKLKLQGQGAISGYLELAENSALTCISPYFSMDDSQRSASIPVGLPPVTDQQTYTIKLKFNNGRRDQDGAKLWTQDVETDKQYILTLNPSQPGRLEIEEELLIFQAGIKERQLHLRNTGSKPITVLLARQPSGFNLVPTPAQYFIPANASFALTVSMEANPSTSAPGELKFQHQDQNISVSLNRVIETPPDSRLPRYIVGLDFGTRNSSAILRDIKINDPQLAVEFLPAGAPREPSFMYYSLQTAQLYFADKAVAQMLNEGPDRGIFIDELKQYLIKDEEPFVARAEALRSQLTNPSDLVPERFRVDALLERYLRYWYQTHISPAIEQRSENGVPEVHYVFSVPVLDRDGPLYERHVARMKTALGRAGFPMDDEQTYSFVQEPVAAALYFLTGRARNAILNARVQKMLSEARLQDGIRLVILDSGGGTTDIAFGTVKVDAAGKIDFELHETLGLDAEERRFGGVNVTDDMFDALTVEQNLGAVVARAIGRAVQNYEIKYQIVEPTKIYFNAAGDQTVPTITPANFDQVLSSSRAVSESLRDNLTGLFQQIRNYRPALTFDMRSSLLDTIIAQRWRPLEQVIRDKILNGQDINQMYVVLVGGNTHIRALGARCADLFSRNRLIDLSALLNYRIPDLKEDDKMLAVAGGTVWRYGARITNLTPYTLELRMCKCSQNGIWETEQEPLAKREASSLAVFSKEITRDLSGLRGAKIEFYANYEGQPKRVHIISLDTITLKAVTTLYADFRTDRVQILSEDKQLLGEYLY